MLVKIRRERDEIAPENWYVGMTREDREDVIARGGARELRYWGLWSGAHQTSDPDLAEATVEYFGRRYQVSVEVRYRPARLIRRPRPYLLLDGDCHIGAYATVPAAYRAAVARGARRIRWLTPYQVPARRIELPAAEKIPIVVEPYGAHPSEVARPAPGTAMPDRSFAALRRIRLEPPSPSPEKESHP